MEGAALYSIREGKIAFLIDAFERRKKMKTLKTSLGVMVVFLLLFSAGSAMAMQEEIVGTVMQNGDSYALLAHSGEYLVTGKDLKGYVGDTVATIGDVYTGVDIQTIRIDSVKVLSHKDLITPDLKNTPSKS
jgi:hypothetical protein